MAYKKIFVDSDVILDLLLKREPFFRFSQVLFNGVPYEPKLTTSALVLANVHYLLRKHMSKGVAKSLLKEISDVVEILSFERQHLMLAINDEHPDFEDRIQFYIATENKCDLIITRNVKDYKNSTIPVLTTEQFLRTII